MMKKGLVLLKEEEEEKKNCIREIIQNNKTRKERPLN